MPAIIYMKKVMVSIMNDFAVILEDYFVKYLSVERGCSINTRKTYRDTFAEVLDYLNAIHHIPANRVTMDTFDFNIVNGFLDWLEETKCVSVSTRNNRLAGLKSFSNMQVTKSRKTLIAAMLFWRSNRKKRFPLR